MQILLNIFHWPKFNITFAICSPEITFIPSHDGKYTPQFNNNCLCITLLYFLVLDILSHIMDSQIRTSSLFSHVHELYLHWKINTYIPYINEICLKFSIGICFTYIYKYTL